MSAAEKTEKAADSAAGSVKEAENKKKRGHVVRGAEERAVISAQILAEMATGKSLRSACEKAGLAPMTFIDWAAADPALSVQYARAREAAIDKMAEEILSISDAPVGSTDNGSTDSGAVQKQRLQVDSRKWLLSKMAPKKYGDKVALTGGDDEDPPIRVNATVTPAEAYKRMLNG